VTSGQDRAKKLAPHTSLVGECGQTKVTKAKWTKTKNVPWHWDEVHQRAFDHIKAAIAKDVVSLTIQTIQSL
jgi:hypothetical protein